MNLRRTNSFIEAKADTLTQLVEIAKIQSTESSNKIEGIYTSDSRLRELVKDKQGQEQEMNRKLPDTEMY